LSALPDTSPVCLGNRRPPSLLVFRSIDIPMERRADPLDDFPADQHIGTGPVVMRQGISCGAEFEC
jgi:hypothetical protein